MKSILTLPNWIVYFITYPEGCRLGGHAGEGQFEEHVLAEFGGEKHKSRRLDL